MIEEESYRDDYTHLKINIFYVCTFYFVSLMSIRYIFIQSIHPFNLRFIYSFISLFIQLIPLPATPNAS